MVQWDTVSGPLVPSAESGVHLAHRESRPRPVRVTIVPPTGDGDNEARSCGHADVGTAVEPRGRPILLPRDRDGNPSPAPGPGPAAELRSGIPMAKGMSGWATMLIRSPGIVAWGS